MKDDRKKKEEYDKLLEEKKKEDAARQKMMEEMQRKQREIEEKLRKEREEEERKKAEEERIRQAIIAEKKRIENLLISKEYDITKLLNIENDEHNIYEVDEKVKAALNIKNPHELIEYIPNKKDNEYEYLTLERDLRKMTLCFRNQTVAERIHAKFAILKYNIILTKIYERYCLIGGDRAWLNDFGFEMLCRDGYLIEKKGKCTISYLRELFGDTFAFYHKKHNQQISYFGQAIKSPLLTINDDEEEKEEKIEFDDDGNLDIDSLLTIDNNKTTKNEEDPWTGIFKNIEHPKNVFKIRKVGDLKLIGCINDFKTVFEGHLDSIKPSHATCIVTFKSKTNEKKREWNMKINLPQNKNDKITIEIKWSDIASDIESKAMAKKRTGTFILTKEKYLDDNDKELPNDELQGLSRHEFFDIICQISKLKYQTKLKKKNLDDNLYDCILALGKINMENNILNLQIKTNENNFLENNILYKKQLNLTKDALIMVFNHYSELDGAEDAGDDGLGLQEYQVFIEDLQKNGKIFFGSYKIDTNDIFKSFNLSLKTSLETELTFRQFQVALTFIIHFMFKEKPQNVKINYKVLSFEKKYDEVFKLIKKMSQSLKAKKSQLAEVSKARLNKLKIKSSGNLTSQSSVHNTFSPQATMRSSGFNIIKNNDNGTPQTSTPKSPNKISTFPSSDDLSPLSPSNSNN